MCRGKTGASAAGVGTGIGGWSGGGCGDDNGGGGGAIAAAAAAVRRTRCYQYGRAVVLTLATVREGVDVGEGAVLVLAPERESLVLPLLLCHKPIVNGASANTSEPAITSLYAQGALLRTSSSSSIAKVCSPN